MKRWWVSAPCAVTLVIGMAASLQADTAVAKASAEDAATVVDARSVSARQASVERMHEAAQAPSAKQAVEIATEEILALIRSGQEYAKDDPDRFYAEVEALMQPVMDFPRFARSVMGVWYKQATPAQFERFSSVAAQAGYGSGRRRILSEPGRRYVPAST
ncbi:MAG: ABC transporter substrate-binding protein, partial [Pseudomonadales bacterium]